ncbi:MAG: hypothetical protein FJX53_02420 [Alphaproteobacteria bacterium]|nr:hypothetical protein [Alphaproteobacteria bacterium]
MRDHRLERFSRPRDPVTRLTGDEVGPGLDLRGLRRAAADWYIKNLMGTTATMADGRVVRFNRTGQRETVWAKGETLLRGVPAIRSIIERGEVVADYPGDRPHVRRNLVIAAPVEIAGHRHELAVTVQETVNGRLQYDFTFDTGERPAGGSQPKLATGPGSPGYLQIEGNPGGQLNLVPRQDIDKPRADPKALIADLQARLKALGIADKVRLRLAAAIRNGTAEGAYEHERRLISVVMAAPPQVKA